jgi:hypothetical protein
VKRELIEPKPGDKRYVRRDEKGHFTNEQNDVGKSLTQDRRKHAKNEAPRDEAIETPDRSKEQHDGYHKEHRETR